MVKFLVYLFETGVCLSLFYGGYVLFFRKETYFRFNRLYLVGSMLLALIIPLVHTSFTITDGVRLQGRIGQIDQFKNYYEDLIAMTDPGFEELEDTSVSRTNQVSGLPSENRVFSLPFNLAKAMIAVYVAGLLFFFFRLLLLFHWLYKLVKHNKVTHYKGYRLVYLDSDMPSFSFFHFIFLNRNELTEEQYKQVVAHEMVHVRQRHSADLMIAHVISLFQWFNPLVWRIRKSIKTTHEYLADCDVVNQGYELFDYQSLLLSQLISIHSVELVNNFNLLSIKKRIAMMNKMKSGFLAKMKAVVVIPLTIVVFVLFANLTVRATASGDHPIMGGKLSTGEALSGLELPTAIHVKELKSEKCLRIILEGNKVSVGGDKGSIGKLPALLIAKKAEYSAEQLKKLTVLIEMDKSIPMKAVSDLEYELRKLDLLKLAYAVKKDGVSGANDKSWIYGFAFKLPPMDADKELLEPTDLDEKGISLYEIDAVNKSKSVDNVRSELKSFILSNEKYMMRLSYSNETNYQDYLDYRDMVYGVIYKLRDKIAMKKFGKPFGELSKEQQTKLKKKYPITLMATNVDRSL